MNDRIRDLTERLEKTKAISAEAWAAVEQLRKQVAAAEQTAREIGSVEISITKQLISAYQENTQP